MSDLRFSPEEYRSLVDSAPDAVIVVDGEGRILLTNRRTSELFGYARDEMIGHPIEILIPERFHAAHRRSRGSYRDTPNPRPMGSGLELFGRRKDGSEFPVEISLSPVAGDRALFASAIRDVSDRKRIERELRAAHEIAESANRAKSQFLATASHDLRQPLQTLRLLNGALEEAADGAELREIVAHQAQAIGAMSNLLNSLLDISKLEAGVVKPEIADFEVRELMQGLRREFDAVARRRGIELQIEECDELVHSDPTLVGQILRNLVANAVKFTEHGFVRLRCLHDAMCVRLEVADSGIGIPPQELARVFEDFYQVQRGGGRKSEGFGLGLAIVKRLADLLGVKLSVESEAARGTRFVIDLPMSTAKPRPATPVRERSRNPAFAVAHDVLLVEDDEGLRFASRRWLTGRGLNVPGRELRRRGAGRDRRGIPAQADHLRLPPRQRRDRARGAAPAAFEARHPGAGADAERRHLADHAADHRPGRHPAAQQAGRSRRVPRRDPRPASGLILRRRSASRKDARAPPEAGC